MQHPTRERRLGADDFPCLTTPIRHLGSAVASGCCARGESSARCRTAKQGAVGRGLAADSQWFRPRPAAGRIGWREPQSHCSVWRGKLHHVPRHDAWPANAVAKESAQKRQSHGEVLGGDTKAREGSHASTIKVSPMSPRSSLMERIEQHRPHSARETTIRSQEVWRVRRRAGLDRRKKGLSSLDRNRNDFASMLDLFPPSDSCGGGGGGGGAEG
jgi:hypothetical protein